MRSNKRPLLIAITGNIGSGKSTVSRIVGEKYPLYSADVAANRFLDEPSVQQKLTMQFGRDLIKDNKINRKQLASMVFSNSDNLRYLESLLHPLVLKEFEQIILASSEPYLFFEIPLLFEAGIEKCFDYIILVTADPETRIQRLVRRDGSSPADIEKRIQFQIPDEEKIPFSNLVINNDLDPHSLENQVLSFLNGLHRITFRQIRSLMS